MCSDVFQTLDPRIVRNDNRDMRLASSEKSAWDAVAITTCPPLLVTDRTLTAKQRDDTRG